MNESLPYRYTRQVRKLSLALPLLASMFGLIAGDLRSVSAQEPEERRDDNDKNQEQRRRTLLAQEVSSLLQKAKQYYEEHQKDFKEEDLQQEASALETRLRSQGISAKDAKKVTETFVIAVLELEARAKWAFTSPEEKDEKKVAALYSMDEEEKKVDQEAGNFVEDTTPSEVPKMLLTLLPCYEKEWDEKGISLRDRIHLAIRFQEKVFKDLIARLCKEISDSNTKLHADLQKKARSFVEGLAQSNKSIKEIREEIPAELAAFEKELGTNDKSHEATVQIPLYRKKIDEATAEVLDEMTRKVTPYVSVEVREIQGKMLTPGEIKKAVETALKKAPAGWMKIERDIFAYQLRKALVLSKAPEAPTETPVAGLPPAEMPTPPPAPVPAAPEPAPTPAPTPEPVVPAPTQEPPAPPSTSLVEPVKPPLPAPEPTPAPEPAPAPTPAPVPTPPAPALEPPPLPQPPAAEPSVPVPPPAAPEPAPPPAAPPEAPLTLERLAMKIAAVLARSIGVEVTDAKIAEAVEKEAKGKPDDEKKNLREMIGGILEDPEAIAKALDAFPAPALAPTPEPPAPPPEPVTPEPAPPPPATAPAPAPVPGSAALASPQTTAPRRILVAVVECEGKDPLRGILYDRGNSIIVRTKEGDITVPKSDIRFVRIVKDAKPEETALADNPEPKKIDKPEKYKEPEPVPTPEPASPPPAPEEPTTEKKEKNPESTGLEKLKLQLNYLKEVEAGVKELARLLANRQSIREETDQKKKKDEIERIQESVKSKFGVPLAELFRETFDAALNIACDTFTTDDEWNLQTLYLNFVNNLLNFWKEALRRRKELKTDNDKRTAFLDSVRRELNKLAVNAEGIGQIIAGLVEIIEDPETEAAAREVISDFESKYTEKGEK